jgi:predicted  nucleic acid-binding Zn-ribbon protein
MKLLVDSRMSELTVTIKTLEANILARDGKIAMLEKTNSELYASLNAAVAKCDEMEQYSKRENLIISGIPASAA